MVLAVLAVLLLAVGFLWQKLSHIQSELARASTDSANFAMEARATAKAAQDTARDVSTRLGVAEGKLAEASLQRSQLEELMQSLSRSRDDNLLSDIDAALRLAQQQSQMLGSAEPLQAALKTAEQRLRRASQPRLAPVARAISHDMDRLKAARILDIANASLSLDEVSRMVDELPLMHDLPGNNTAKPAKPANANAMSTVLGWGERFWEEVKRLVRVSRIDAPEAALLSPSQSFFARENLKLRLLNARMGLMTRQLPSAGSDLQSAQQSLVRHFDPNAKAVQIARERITQVQAQLKNSELPRLDETLTALATAAGATGK
jgi:uroporphyrin-3 C-methyltransferase